MQENKKRSGLRQGALALLGLYVLVTLVPAGAGLLKKSRGETPAAPPAAESTPPPESALPGFLETRTPAEPPEEPTFTLYDSSAEKTLELTAQELLPAAIACEMDLAAPEEALKAQAVACYTLFSRKRSAGETIVCDSSQWQVWTDQEHMQQRWGEDYEENLALLEGIAEDVRGELLTWEGKPILAAYFAISPGSTETSGNAWVEDLPYLQTVASPGDSFSDGYLSTAVLSPEEFQEAAQSCCETETPDFSGPPEEWLTDLTYTPAGFVDTGLLGGVPVSGSALRSAFSLRSACFQVEYQENQFLFTVRGWGHGVGMSQAGAVFLAKRGAGHAEILSHYYPGALLTRT